jgi:predicted RNase H-like HicB family nuclease
MEMDVYGFKAKVTISEGTYSGEIEELHVITQAKTLRQLKARLEEATELTVDAIIKDPKEARNYPSSVPKKLGLKIYA